MTFEQYYWELHSILSPGLQLGEGEGEGGRAC